MSQRTGDDSETNDRILSNFSTDPELVGYSHKTWALAVLFVGIVLFLLPLVMPLPVALIAAVAFLAGMGILFSAAPPHLSPWEFAYRRITHQTQQQIYIPDRNSAVRRKYTDYTKDNTDE